MDDEIHKRLVTKIYNDNYTLWLARTAKYYRSNQDREDVIQQFFCNKIYSFPAPVLKEIVEEKGQRYLFVMLKNFILDELRKQKKNKTEELSEQIDEIIGSSSKAQLEFEEREIEDNFKKRILNKFGAKFLEIFELHLLGYANPEIAKIINEKTSYVGTAKFRIREYLKEV